MKNCRILIVDDNESIHNDYRKILLPQQAGLNDKLESLEASLFGNAQQSPGDAAHIDYEVDFAHQGEQALEMAQAAAHEGRPYAMCFVDVRMPPGWDGIQTIARIWQELPYTEMVICTAYSDYSWDDIITALGSTDHLLFIGKPFDATAIKQMALSLVTKWNLGNDARNYVAHLEQEVNERTAQLQGLLRELNQKNKELEQLALHDTLTGLSNRVLFNDRLSHSVERAQRNKHRFAVMMMDLNRFKDVNDTYGHHVGDCLLREVGARLRNVLRGSDTVARLGGDEFAVILYDTAPDACDIIAKKIEHDMLLPASIDGHIITASASVGIAMYPEHGNDPETLLRRADTAMYAAKRSNRGYVVFDPHDDAHSVDRVQLVNELDAAIRDNGLMLYYQPIINLETHRIGGVEALARWNHAARGLILPLDFIPLAEQKGLIQPLTKWVLETAIVQCVQWHRAGAQIEMSVNLSTRNFMDPTLPHHIENCLKKHHLEPHWLTLEITEGMTISNPDRALEIMHTIDDMGIRLSVDDFGTGYSSLAYLMKLPVKEVKIDRSFVMGLADGRNNRAIVQSTIDLVHSLGMKAVGEGIESEKILKILIEMGCDKVQGYYLCTPQSASEISTWLHDSPWGVGDKPL